MQQNLLEEVETYFTEDTVSQASAVVGESERAVEKALAKIIPLVLSSFIGRAERPGGVEALWILADEATDSGGRFQELLTAERLKRRTELMQGLLGEGYPTTVSRIADTTRLKSSSVETLLSMAAQAVLQSLGAHAHQKEMNAPDLFAWLERQKGSIMEAMLLNTNPASATGPLAGSFTRQSITAPPPNAVDSRIPTAPGGTWNNVAGGNTYVPPMAPPAPASGTLRWAMLLLLIVAGAILEYVFVQNRLSNNSPAATPPAALNTAGPAPRTPPTAAGTSGRYDAASGNYIYDPGRPITLTLVDGTTQTVGVNSTENRLYNFLADPANQVDSVNRTKGWINFDRIYFDTRKATLTDESRSQLRNVASILKSFPNSHVKIGGYTDVTGNVLDNLKLSEARANAAMAELVALGVPLSRIEAKGYGGKYGVADNATPVGRALNRRISIRVTQK